MGDGGPGRLPEGQGKPADLTGGDSVPRLGDVPTPGLSRRSVYLEVLGLWLGTLLLIRLALVAQRGLGLPDWVLAVVPLLFIYAPVALCRYRKVDSYAYRLSIPAFRDFRAWGRSAGFAAVVALAITVPWVAGYHVYQAFFPHVVATASSWWTTGQLDTTLLWPAGRSLSEVLASVGPRWSRLPDDMLTLVAYQIFFVAIPEEFFYRGYLQTRLNELHGRRWAVGGAMLGSGAIVANLLFAFGHSVVQLQWWHFATFFPGLLFAWMRERSGRVVPGALFHAFCNVSVMSLDALYGVG